MSTSTTGVVKATSVLTPRFSMTTSASGEAPPPVPSTVSDRALLVGVAAAPALGYLFAFTLDDRRTFVDESYNTVTVNEGNAVVLAQLLALAFCGALGAHILIRGLLAGRQPLTWLAIPAILLTVFSLLRDEFDLANFLGMVVGVVVLLAAPSTRVDDAALTWLGRYALVFTVSVWLVAFVDLQEAFKPCRPDKCGLGGSLMQSYMSHENILGLYVAFLVPALAFLPRGLFLGGLVATTATVASTGSRTAALTVAVTTLIALALTWHRAAGARRRRPLLMPILSIVPAAASATALGVFLLLPAAGLTDRGAIWELARAHLRGAALLVGPGPAIFQDAFENSDTTWLIPHAHNEVAHLLVDGGVLALGFFFAALLTLAVVGLRSGDARVSAFAVGPSLSFGTEIVWSYNFLASFLWTVFITIALMTPHARGDSERVASALGGPKWN